MCSVAVAEGLPAAGLVLIAYPLHPRANPSSATTTPSSTCPASSSRARRTFGSPDELEARTQTIPGPVTYTWIDGKRRRRGADDQIAETVVSWLDQVT